MAATHFLCLQRLVKLCEQRLSVGNESLLLLP
jgi:hypothetical protein